MIVFFHSQVLIEKWTPPSSTIEIGGQNCSLWFDDDGKYQRLNGLPSIEFENKHIFIKNDIVSKVEYFKPDIQDVRSYNNYDIIIYLNYPNPEQGINFFEHTSIPNKKPTLI